MAERNFRTERYIYVGSDYDSGIEMPDGKFIVPHEMYDSDVAKLDIDYPNNGLFELKTTQNGDGSTPENGSNTPSGNASNQSTYNGVTVLSGNEILKNWQVEINPTVVLPDAPESQAVLAAVQTYLAENASTVLMTANGLQSAVIGLASAGQAQANELRNSVSAIMASVMLPAVPSLPNVNIGNQNEVPDTEIVDALVAQIASEVGDIQTMGLTLINDSIAKIQTLQTDIIAMLAVKVTEAQATANSTVASLNPQIAALQAQITAVLGQYKATILGKRLDLFGTNAFVPVLGFSKETVKKELRTNPIFDNTEINEGDYADTDKTADDTANKQLDDLAAKFAN